MNNELCYGLVPADELPAELPAAFQTRKPRILATGQAILKWRGDCPEPAWNWEQNRYQQGIEKRRWYTHSEILRVLDEERDSNDYIAGT